ncbi:MAG TPA: FlgD immunoglobulin-like domain containing protein, partial [Vicinamibacterales bacterium]|nr:FlgD immunoglobulin-like domain containing protein [Vicinamibacterales bacterium]
QAASLVGHDALVAGSRFALAEDTPMQGIVHAPGPGQINVEISDGTGQIVRRFTLNANTAGPLPFTWDGINDQGIAAPPGNYQVSARITNDGTTYALETEVGARIESVSFGQGGLVLNLAGIGPMPFSAVRRIG